MTTYIDASVLLRIVLSEPDPLATWRDVEPVASELVRVEALRTVDRARSTLAIDSESAASQRAAILDTLRSFTIAPVSAVVLQRAADPFPTPLGTLDAIHLATAIELRDEFPALEFATHDRELATAAKAMGFAVNGV